MIRPSPGLMAFHNGHPIEFLHRIEHPAAPSAEGWLAKPLFVADPVNRVVWFTEGDRLTPLHSKAA